MWYPLVKSGADSCTAETVSASTSTYGTYPALLVTLQFICLSIPIAIIHFKSLLLNLYRKENSIILCMIYTKTRMLKKKMTEISWHVPNSRLKL